MKQAIIYIRDGAQFGLGASKYSYSDSHRAYCEIVANGLDARVVADFEDFVDNSDPVRPQLEAAMELCQQSQIDYLITYWMLDLQYPGFDIKAFVGALARFGTELIYCQQLESA